MAAELAKLLQKPEPEKVVNVEMGAALQSTTMKGLGAELWPRASAVNALATEAAKQKKNGTPKKVIFAELKRFMPLWMSDDKDAVAHDDDSSGPAAELRKEMGLAMPKKNESTMSMAAWSAAFEPYALATAATQQWDYVAAMTHRALVCRIASSQRASCPVGVAVIYDELVRKQMSEKAAARAPGFDQNTPVLEPDKTLLEQATAKYKARGESMAAANPRSWRGGHSTAWPQKQAAWPKRHHQETWGDSAKRHKQH